MMTPEEDQKIREALGNFNEIVRIRLHETRGESGRNAFIGRLRQVRTGPYAESVRAAAEALENLGQ